MCVCSPELLQKAVWCASALWPANGPSVDWAPWLLVPKHSKQAARKQMGRLTNTKNILYTAVKATCSRVHGAQQCVFNISWLCGSCQTPYCACVCVCVAVTVCGGSARCLYSWTGVIWLNKESCSVASVVFPNAYEVLIIFPKFVFMHHLESFRDMVPSVSSSCLPVMTLTSDWRRPAFHNDGRKFPACRWVIFP